MRQKVCSIFRYLGHELDDCVSSRSVEFRALGPTRMSLLRAALEFKNAKSMAAWSIRARLVASGNLTRSAVNNCEGP